MAKNYFYFKVPFRSDFSLREGNILENQSAYGELWNRIKRSDINHLPDGKTVRANYLHHCFEEDELQFESVDKDSSMIDAFSPIVLHITPQEWFEEIIDRKSAAFFCNCFGEEDCKKMQYLSNSCRITLYKNTLSTIEFTFSLNMENKEICRDCIKKLEQWSNDFSAYMVDYAYKNILLPFINKLRSFDNKYSFFCASGKHIGFPDVYDDSSPKRMIKRSVRCGIPLWVSRSLVVEQRGEGFEELLNRWVIAAESKEEIAQQFSKQKDDEKNRIYLGWMHSLMLGNINDKVIKDAFYALGLAQYYYAIFDSLNQNLSQIIGISHKKRSVKQTRQYKKMLEEMIFVTDLIKINFSDITQGLQRNRAFFFGVLVRQWTIDNIMENVQKKITLCKDNISKIYQQAFNRSQKVAELLLFFISGFAILEFLKGLSEFFHKPESISQDVWGLYSIGKVVEPNTMMWIGLLLFAIVFVIYFRLLKDKD